MEQETDGTRRVAACQLRRRTDPWPYAQHHAAEIAEAWQQRIWENPALFDGVVHVARAASLAVDDTGALTGDLWRSDFKSFLHWRRAGYPDAEALDVFGSAIVHTAEGHVLLGRQRAGINAGLTYLPGGFIDERDIDANGTLDLVGHVGRELAEETGLQMSLLTRRPGVWVTRCGRLLSLGIEVHDARRGDDLQADVRAWLAAEGAGGRDMELDDVVIIRTPTDHDRHRVPAYSRHAVERVLSAAG